MNKYDLVLLALNVMSLVTIYLALQRGQLKGEIDILEESNRSRNSKLASIEFSEIKKTLEFENQTNHLKAIINQQSDDAKKSVTNREIETLRGLLRCCRLLQERYVALNAPEFEIEFASFVKLVLRVPSNGILKTLEHDKESQTELEKITKFFSLPESLRSIFFGEIEEFVNSFNFEKLVEFSRNQNYTTQET